MIFIIIIIIISQCSSSSALVRCYSCASDDYIELWPIDRARPLIFSNICDRSERVQTIAPIVHCHNTCVTIFETQYVGVAGLMMDTRPYTYIRACSSDLFASQLRSAHRPREVDFLLNEQICVQLPMSEIWPTIIDGLSSSSAVDNVQVCSCVDDRCNSVDTVSSSSLTIVNYLMTTILLTINWLF